MTSAEIIARLGLDTASFERGVKRAQGMVGGLRKAFSGLGGLLGAGTLMGFAKQAIDSASAVMDMATATRTGVEELQALNHAARMAGASEEQMAQALVKVQKSVADAASGSQGAAEAFSRLGLSAKDMTAMSPDKMLEQVAMALRRAGNSTDAYGAAMDILGTRTAPKLMAVLQQLGDEGIGSMIAAAKEAGGFFDRELAESLDRAGDNLEKFKNRATVAMGVVTSLFTQVGEWMGKTLGEMIYGEADEAAMDFFREQARKNLGGKTDKAIIEAEAKRLKSLDDERQEAGRKAQEEARRQAEERAREAVRWQEQMAEVDRVYQKEMEKAGQERLKRERENNEKLRSGVLAKISDLYDQAAAAVSAAREQIERKDPGKMTVQELANISKFAPGVGLDTIRSGMQARELMQLRNEAEKARLSGNVSGFWGYDEQMAKARALEEEMFRAGKLRSSEVSPEIIDKVAAENAKNQTDNISAEIGKSNEILKEIEKAIKSERAYK